MSLYTSCTYLSIENQETSLIEDIYPILTQRETEYSSPKLQLKENMKGLVC